MIVVVLAAECRCRMVDETGKAKRKRLAVAAARADDTCHEALLSVNNGYMVEQRRNSKRKDLRRETKDWREDLRQETLDAKRHPSLSSFV